MALANPDPLPTTVIAGVNVIDTPLVRAAIKYARAHADDMTYNHIMRCLVFSVIISKNLEKVFGKIDEEAQALAVILHDLGWDHTGELVSKDKRFEVDGAIAARDWIQVQKSNGLASDWDEHRIQLMWDAIALHTTPSILAYKEPVVALVGAGIASDFRGPESDPTGTLTWDQFNVAKAEFPRLDLAGGVRKKMCGFAETKPETTYDNWGRDYGLRFVKGYSVEGKLGIDLVENSEP